MYLLPSLPEMTVFLSTFFMAYMCLKSWNGNKTSKRRYPPSLSSLSLLNAVLFKGVDNLADYFSKKSLELGPMFTISFGSRLCLILNNTEVIEAALLKQSRSYAGRETFYTEKDIFNKNRKGIISREYNADFRKYHSTYLTILKEFGFGVHNLLEQRILLEVEGALEQFRIKKGMVFNPNELTVYMVSNVIRSMLFGRRRDFDQGLSDDISLGIWYVEHVDSLLDIAPVLRFMPNRWRNLREMINVNERWVAAINEEIKKCKEPGAPPSFVSRFIDKEGPNYDAEQLIMTLRDLIGAGSDTLISTMLWSYVFLANNLEVQLRMQKEIDEVVPRERLPSIDDKPKLPFVEATIFEIMRIATIVPLAIPHLTFQDTEVRGYFIPSGTVVLPNLHAAHMNPHDWVDPDKFRPDRFLDNDNRLSNCRIIPFSVGRRACLGEILARHELLLFISGIVQNFTIQPPDGKQSIDVSQHGMIVIKPSTFEVKMIPRMSHCQG